MQTIREFLERAGPNQPVQLALTPESTFIRGSLTVNAFKVPARLQLYCRVCEGERGFNTDTRTVEVTHGYNQNEFWVYRCKDCEKTTKTYAVRLWTVKGGGVALVKFGEVDPFGPQYDPRVGELLGADDHLYRKGLECESAGMGIGAFAYYRRLLENQRAALFAKVVEVAAKLNAPADLMDALKKTQGDSQFSKAIEAIKAGPLQAIYINGHNPLTLLYDAVSDGLHRQPDEDNMEVAQTIRLLLADLARRLEEVLADHKEVETAVTRLLKAQAERRAKAAASTDTKK